jgi:hypothetical protein
MISRKTAMEISYAYREIETAKKLLAEITEAISRHQQPDIRDSFGRSQGGLRLGVPSGESATQLFNVPWNLAKPVIEAHIASQESILSVLMEHAKLELQSASELQ